MDLLPLVIGFAVFLFSLSVHESAHAWTAWRLGDWTGKALGRVTLNPIPHIDPVGTLALPLILGFLSHGQIVFGYAKPVPYNPYAMKNPALGSAAVAVAGPTSNLVLASIAAVSLGFLSPGGVVNGTLGQELLQKIITLNVLLGLFNLIPVPPLDGFTVVAGLLPRGMSRAWSRIELAGPILFVILMISGVLNRILYPAVKVVAGVLLDVARGIRG